MKISNVNNVKTAVTGLEQIENEKYRGIVYSPKDKKGQTKGQVEIHVDDRIKAAKKTPYNIFDIQKLKKNKVDNDIQSYAKEINKIISRDFIKNSNPQKDKIAGDIKNITCKDKATYVDALIEKGLRRSLSKGNIITCLKNCINNGETEIFSFIKSDYNREKVKKHAGAGIKHQNMDVQPDDTKILTPPAKEKKKPEKKEAFVKFLQDYATLDDDARTDLLRKLRRLVLLYFYGESKIPNNADFDIWKEHNDRKSEAKRLDKNAEDQNIEKPYELKEHIRQQNKKWFTSCKEVVKKDQNTEEKRFFEDENLNLFWMNRISKSVENIYKHRPKGDHKLSIGYLSEKVWKDMLAYISTNYIKIGKAVFNTAVSDLKGSNQKLGVIQPAYEDGLTSFDYEVIKAEEQLQRKIQVNVAFAANNLASATAVVGDGQDFLAGNIEPGVIDIRENSVRNVLQFFGGKSSWEDSKLDEWEHNYKLVESLKKALYALRNENFHFKTLNTNEVTWCGDLIKEMIEHDIQVAGKVFKDKFFSNSLPMFYEDSDLEEALKKLYGNNKPAISQMPSFKKVFVRINFPEYIDTFAINKIANWNDSTKDEWYSAVYYLMREIYYRDFMHDGKIKDKFIQKVKDNCNEEEKTNPGLKETQAIKNFKGRICEMEGSYQTLPEICQKIMTEQNMHNQGGLKKKNSEQKKDNKYKHYEMLLHKTLREVFKDYVKANYKFILLPEKRVLPDLEDFLPDLKIDVYKDLLSNVDVESKPYLQKWYVLGRLLNGKQINSLIGDICSYIQYKKDIVKRAKYNDVAGTKVDAWIDENELSDLEIVLELLDICRKLCGRTSNILNDYFDNEKEYADFVGKFLDYDSAVGDSSADKLRAFCQGGVGIFYDAQNPIMNRNILMAKLYGNVTLLNEILKNQRVTKNDIDTLKGDEKTIIGYKAKGRCDKEDEQKSLKKYQELKNHVEFTDILEYKDIVDELYGRLINMMYLRERDLMYFQLGFHYYCLNFTGEDKLPSDYKKINNIENAILYQIISIYISGLETYKRRGNTKEGEITQKKGKTMRAGIDIFRDYTKAMKAEKEYINIKDEMHIYNAGLEVFEKLDEHDDINKFRNYIDHFRYYSTVEYSLLDLYSDVFDRFFSYDNKFRKNVVNQIYNVLQAHFVQASFKIETTNEGYNRSRKHAQIRLRDEENINYSLISEKFTYKIGKEKTDLQLAAKSDTFKKNVAAILYYPNHDSIKEMLSKESEDTGTSKKGSNISRDNFSWSSLDDQGETEFARKLREAQEKKKRS